MRTIISWFLLLTGMSGAALAAARLGEEATVSALLLDVPFWLGMFAVLLAILVNQKGRSRATTQNSREASVPVQVSRWIEEILSHLDQIDRSAPMNERISALTKLQEGLIFSVTSAKDHLIVSKGYSFYARFMSDFAVAERFLARAWSAAVDGYPDESNTYLEKAHDFFAQSKEILEGETTAEQAG